MSESTLEIKKMDFLRDLNSFLDKNDMKVYKNLEELINAGKSLKKSIENSGIESLDNRVFLQLINVFLENHNGLNGNEQTKREIKAFNE